MGLNEKYYIPLKAKMKTGNYLANDSGGGTDTIKPRLTWHCDIVLCVTGRRRFVPWLTRDGVYSYLFFQARVLSYRRRCNL